MEIGITSTMMMNLFWLKTSVKREVSIEAIVMVVMANMEDMDMEVIVAMDMVVMDMVVIVAIDMAVMDMDIMVADDITNMEAIMVENMATMVNASVAGMDQTETVASRLNNITNILGQYSLFNVL